MATEKREVPPGTFGDDAGVPFHTLDTKAVGSLMGVSIDQGLSAAEAAQRLSRYGPNAIEEKPGRGVASMIAAQFADFMILLLIAAAAISGVVGDLKDTLVIVLIVVINAIIGFSQEFRAERALSALKNLIPSRAVVVRDGRHVEIPVAEIVPGDLVVIEAGNQVPADLRLIDRNQIRISEATLTGESVPVDKRTEAIAAKDLPIGDQRNMAFKGTAVTYGLGRGIAIATGMHTELGKLANLLGKRAETQTPLQQRLARFGKRLALVVVAICGVIFVTGLARGEPPLLMFLTAVSLAVAAIPEALPATVTILLAVGAHTMARRNAMVRRLAAVETLGSVTFICSDKTGTLTKNEMELERVRIADGSWSIGDSALQAPAWTGLLAALALNNDAHQDDDGSFFGDPTEVALKRAAAEQGTDLRALTDRFPRTAEFAFDSVRKRMTTVHPSASGFIAYVKGAPEAVIDRCVAVFTAGSPRAVDRAWWRADADRMASAGLRVLAVAQRQLTDLPALSDSEEVESELTLLGLVGLVDPPRPEVAAAVQSCQTAGIAVVMITGDHPATARAIAGRLGILETGGAVVSGAALGAMSDSDLASQADVIRVYARVDPAQKIRVVEALQARGEYVAMTGDGVNDAPALKRADIGVAMGKIGTDVAREASSLVLLDDNFATIVAAVREGRRIYDNLRKVIKFIMTGNSAEILTIFLAPFLGLPIPLLPIHILWINLVTDSLPALAMAAEPEEHGLMRRPPRPPKESIFAGGMWQHMVWVGALIGALSLTTQAYDVGVGSRHAQTMVLTVLTLSQLVHALAIRSDRLSLFQQGILSNLPLVGAVTLVVLLQMAVIYVPVMNTVLSTAPLSPMEMLACVGASLIVFLAVEAEKWLVRSGRLRRT
ncbi:MAG TPA: cation-translocating P-type ATPase [Bauldia sp.]